LRVRRNGFIASDTKPGLKRASFKEDGGNENEVLTKVESCLAKSGLSHLSITVKHEDWILQIDWAGLRAAAVAVGIRRAARQAARDLPLDEQERFVQRAMKRCSREKWLVKAQQDRVDAVTTSPTTLSADVRKGSDVLSELLAEDSRETRIGLSSAARNAAETFAKMPGAKVIKHAQGHRHITASSSQLHGWDSAQARGQETLVSVQILNER
jgi:hypothetical protein